MKMRSLLVPTLFVLALYSAGVAPAAGQATQPGSVEGTVFVPWEANSVWTIAYDLEISPLPEKVLVTLLQSSELHRAAVKRLHEQIPVPPDDFLESVLVSFDPLPVGPRITRGAVPVEEGLAMGRVSVQITKATMPPVANEYAECLRAALEAALQKAHKRDLEVLEEQVEGLSNEANRLQGRLRELQKRRQELSQAAGRPDPSREAVVQASQQLQNEKQKLEMELAARQARREALQEQMARAHKGLAENLKGNAMLAELEKMVRALQESLNHQQQRLVELKDRGPEIVNPTRAKIEETQKKLAEAITQVTQVRESASRSSGEELLGKLNGELATLAVSMAETQVRQKMLDERLARLNKSLDVADLYEQDIALQLPSLKKAYEALQERQNHLRQRISGSRPTKVTSLGSGDAEALASQPAKTR